jgi:hypothetical protein
MDIPYQDVGKRVSQLQTGHWAPFIYGGWLGALPEKQTVSIRCPICKRLFCLAKHNVALDGSVSPSVVCPHRGCIFHQFIRLLDYNPK